MPRPPLIEVIYISRGKINQSIARKQSLFTNFIFRSYRYTQLVHLAVYVNVIIKTAFDRTELLSALLSRIPVVDGDLNSEHIFAKDKD